MSRTIEDYLREVSASLRVDAERRRQIVDELRTHLTEKAEDLQRADPTRVRAELEREVVRDFGEARDLALAYEPEGTAVLLNSTGDIVLRLGRAVGRGAVAVGRNTGRFLKWTAVALAILLVTSLGVGAWAYYEIKPYIPSIIESSEPAYSSYERCAATPCHGGPPADSFYVRAGTETLRFDLDLYAVHPADERAATHVGNGTVRIVVTDPTGAARFDRAFNMTEGSSLHQEWSWAATEGNWTLAYTFDGFVGALDVEVYTRPFAEER